MRFVSLFATLAVAATSFVAAAPVANSNDLASPQPTIIDVISKANSKLNPLCDELTSLAQSSHPDFNKVDSVTSQIGFIVSDVDRKVSDITKKVESAVSDAADLKSSDVVAFAQFLRFIAQDIKLMVSSGVVTTHYSVATLITSIKSIVPVVRGVVDAEIKAAVSPILDSVEDYCEASRTVLGV